MIEERFVSYAQNLEDVMLWRALGAAVPDGGFYVDVGAADPTLLSVTRAFYERGWRGVDVEPLPEAAAVLTEARPRDVVVQAALGAAAGQATFYRVGLHRQTGLSTLDSGEAERHRMAGAKVDAIEVPVMTLDELFRAHVTGPVHFLKIDAEGAEGAVLAGADFSVVRPWIVVVEATQALTQARSTDWEAGLVAAGYGFVWFDGLNRFYLAAEHPELAQHFRVQPNVFDAYVVYDPVLRPYLEVVEALAQERLEAVEAVEGERDRLRMDLDELRAEEAAVVRVEVAKPPEAPAAPVPRTLGRRIAMAVYWVVRPVVRPLAWRTRQFMVGDIRRELHEMSQRQAQLLARPVATSGGTDAAMAGTMERLLLTLALEQGRDDTRAGPFGGSGLSNTGPGS